MILGPRTLVLPDGFVEPQARCPGFEMGDPGPSPLGTVLQPPECDEPDIEVPNPPGRCELLGEISLLSPGRPFNPFEPMALPLRPPDPMPGLSSLLDLSVSQLS